MHSKKLARGEVKVWLIRAVYAIDVLVAGEITSGLKVISLRH